jgi:hypothetical protein
MKTQIKGDNTVSTENIRPVFLDEVRELRDDWLARVQALSADLRSQGFEVEVSTTDSEDSWNSGTLVTTQVLKIEIRKPVLPEENRAEREELWDRLAGDQPS